MLQLLRAANNRYPMLRRLSVETPNPTLLMAAGLLVLTLSCGYVVAKEMSVGGRAASNGDEGKIVLEGVRLHDELGEFKVRGDRAIFISNDGKLQFSGLENRNLERIVRKIADNPSQLTWAVTGMVTEYKSTNYLLITHAVIKSRSTTSPQAKAGKKLDDSP